MGRQLITSFVLGAVAGAISVLLLTERQPIQEVRLEGLVSGENELEHDGAPADRLLLGDSSEPGEVASTANPGRVPLFTPPDRDWEKYAKRIEAEFPILIFKRQAGLDEHGLNRLLDKSDLIETREQLTEALRDMSADNVLESFRIEARFFEELAALKEEAPDDWQQKRHHYLTVVVPWKLRNVDELVVQLHELRCPRSLTRRFREEMLAGT